MIKILLCCSAGMSTSMVVQKMEKAAQQLAVESKIDAVGMEEFTEKLSDYDCCLLGPQIKYKLADFKKHADELNKPVAVINTMDYGMLNGEKILRAAISLVESHKGA
ncbi:PTS sugar transporter subunit IIB [Pantoea sp. MBD-2R]|uniref:PTS sugar transporter subunit IIB n=1 Tax=unclassified Pantoea TaxID=2630326 RepID=UPI0011BD7A52|nr:PTS sugar transporter subunit IIB [Pantoea sp. CCBC3-3-1]